MPGLYIHVPFCIKKCLYCDFYSCVCDDKTKEIYVSAAVRNLKRFSDTSFDTVYFGGGTPTLLNHKQIEKILSVARLEENAEITMECNPETVNENSLSGYKSVGINRISVGVQSLNDKELFSVGRIHDSKQAVKCIENIYSAGIENISADIMLGLPFQTNHTLKNTLEKLLSLPLTHISAYMLKKEEGTPLFYDKKLCDMTADDDTLSDMYLSVCDFLESKGFSRYEISSFAKEGFECRHNLKYWKCEDYIGIGPAAHSCYNGKRYESPKSLKSFLENDFQTEIPNDDTPLDENEKLMLGLRISDGINPDEFSFSEKIKEKAVPLIKAGFLKYNDKRLSLTDTGALVSNEIIVRLME